MKRMVSVFVVVWVCAVTVFAQAEKAEQISGGVLNGKAVSLPKPPYPAAARAVNAEGAVSVQVLIDESGNVVSATAVSGHPLLRAAATEAAQNAKFSPTFLQGEPVKVSGVITYNFVGNLTNAGIGYEIAFAERSGTFTPYVFPKSLAARLPEQWIEERSILDGLQFENSPAADAVKPKDPEPAAVSSNSSGDEKLKKVLVNTYTVKGDPAYQTGQLTAASIESLRRLQNDIRVKLSGDAKNEWHFRLGTAFGVFAAEIDDVNKAARNIGEIEELASTAPAGVSETLLAGVTKFIALAKSSDGSPEARKLLVAGAQGLKNLRV